MRYLKDYITSMIIYPAQIILKRYNHGIYFQGKLQNIPKKFLDYLVIEHSNLNNLKYHQYVIVEEI